jgi:DNA modification methylase
MGQIELIHGNCLEEMKKIPDGSVDLVLTDPPYGTTACKWDTIIPFEPMWEQLKRVTKKNGAIVLFGSQPFTSALVMSNPKMFKYEWVWNKSLAGNGILAKKQPLKIHENILVFQSGVYYPEMRKGKARWKGGIKDKHGTFSNAEAPKVYNNEYYPITIIDVSGAGMRTGRVHPTQKPVDLMEYLIKTYTNENETVLDFTMGSGTTGVACKNLNRNFIGIELDKDYFEIAKKRIEETWQK